MKLNKIQIQKIFRQIDIDEKKIVLIDVMGDKSITSSEKLSNIYCIDQKNNVIWQVTEIDTKPPYVNDGFVHLKKNEGGEIIAVRFSGFTYKINPETGEATQTGFHK